MYKICDINSKLYIYLTLYFINKLKSIHRLNINPSRRLEYQHRIPCYVSHNFHRRL